MDFFLAFIFSLVCVREGHQEGCVVGVRNNTLSGGCFFVQINKNERESGMPEA